MNIERLHCIQSYISPHAPHHWLVEIVVYYCYCCAVTGGRGGGGVRVQRVRRLLRVGKVRQVGERGCHASAGTGGYRPQRVHAAGRELSWQWAEWRRRLIRAIGAERHAHGAIERWAAADTRRFNAAACRDRLGVVRLRGKRSNLLRGEGAERLLGGGVSGSRGSEHGGWEGVRGGLLGVAALVSRLRVIGKQLPQLLVGGVHVEQARGLQHTTQAQ